MRVIATGRNLKKTIEVIPSEIPFDYIVFSSGAGVYDSKNSKLLYRQNLSKVVVQQLVDFLVENDLNFHLLSLFRRTITVGIIAEVLHVPNLRAISGISGRIQNHCRTTS